VTEKYQLNKKEKSRMSIIVVFIVEAGLLLSAIPTKARLYLKTHIQEIDTAENNRIRAIFAKCY
jgi:hypothetical protein